MQRAYPERGENLGKKTCLSDASRPRRMRIFSGVIGDYFPFFCLPVVRRAAKSQNLTRYGPSRRRRQVRVAVVPEASRGCRRRHPDAPPRHWLQHRHLQRDQGGPPQPAAVRGLVPAGRPFGTESRRAERSGCPAHLYRLAGAVERDRVNGGVPSFALCVRGQRRTSRRAQREGDAETFLGAAQQRCAWPHLRGR